MVAKLLADRTPGAIDPREDEIERHLAESLGYEVPTFIRSPEELEAVACYEPDARGEGASPVRSLYVMFLRTPADDDLRAGLAALSSEMDSFTFSGREVYRRMEGKLTESPLFGRGLDKTMKGVLNTARNTTSVRKLVANL